MMNRKILKTIIMLFLVSFLFTIKIFAGNVDCIWTYKSPDINFDASAAIGDVDRDGNLDIVVASLTGDVIALDGYGREIWKTVMGKRITIAPTLVDVTGDTGLEVLVLTHEGRLCCLNSLTGELVWENNMLSTIKWACMTVVASDLDQDGKIEIITADEKGTLLCLDGNGQVIWKYVESEGIGAAPAVGDIDSDGKAEIIIASEDTPLICLDYKGNVIWRFKPEGDILNSGRKSEVSAPVIWDIDGDKKAEILTGMGYNLAAVNNKGKLLWSYPMKNRIDSSISVADADKDGDIEIYAGDLSGNFICVTQDGKLKWSDKLERRARRSPAIADIDGDGSIEVIVAGYGSKMNIYSCSGEPENELLLKGGTNAAAVVADLWGDGGLCIVVPVINGNLVAYRWEPVISDPQVLWAEYRAWASRSAGEFCQNTRKNSKKARPVKMTDTEKQKFADDLSHLLKIEDEINQLLPKLPDSRGITERVYYLSAAIEKSKKLVKNVSKLEPIKRRELRDNLSDWTREFENQLTIINLVAEKNEILGAYTANPWTPFVGMDELAKGQTAKSPLSVEAFQGEFESAAVNLFNFSGSARTLRVMFDEFSAPAGSDAVSTDDVFTLREVVSVPTQDSDLSADPLPELNTGNLLVVPAWDARQLWITVNTAKLTPGTWKAKIHLKSLDVQFVETTVELNIKIWDAPLPKEKPLHLCNWSRTEYPKGTFEDQLAHGVDLFPRTVPATATFDESGEITNIDYTEHDKFMAKHAPHGITLFHSFVKLNGPSPAFSDPWLKAYKSFIPQWIEHLKGLGYGYDKIVFYPQDEPGLEHGKNVANFLKWAKLVRSIDKNILIYANPVQHITMEQIKEIAPYVDIWAPLSTMTFPKEQLDFIHSTNKQFWNYNCSDNGKKLSPLNYYRGQAWMCWKFGHTGIGFWTYFSTPKTWFQPEAGFEYDMVYDGKGVVTSKRWEAVRDGVEDYSLLYALRMATESAEQKNAPKELIEKARHVYIDKAAVIADFYKKHKNNIIIDGYDDDAKWKEIINIRRDIAELLSELLD